MKSTMLLGLALAIFAGSTLALPNASKAGIKRSQMTAAQKKELRRRGREWCMKNHIKGPSTFDRIEIMSDGRVRCWWRG